MLEDKSRNYEGDSAFVFIALSSQSSHTHDFVVAWVAEGTLRAARNPRPSSCGRLVSIESVYCREVIALAYLAGREGRNG